MVITFIKSILLTSALIISLGALAQDGATSAIDSRYIGVWKGAWLEGMSSGKVILDMAESSGQFSFTALPRFGNDPAPISKIKHSETQLGFLTAGADGRVMRFDLKPSSDYKKLKGKAYYDGLHMEVQFTRMQ